MVDLYDQLGDIAKQADWLKTLSSLYGQMGEYTKALNTLHKTLQIAESRNLLKIEARCWVQQAKLYAERGDYSRAIQKLKTALKKIRENNIPAIRIEISIISFLAFYMNKLDSLTAARQYAEETLAISKQLNDSLSIARSILQIGDIQLKSEHPDSALISYQK